MNLDRVHVITVWFFYGVWHIMSAVRNRLECRVNFNSFARVCIVNNFQGLHPPIRYAESLIATQTDKHVELTNAIQTTIFDAACL